MYSYAQKSAGPCASFISFNEMRAGAPLYQPIKHYNFGKVVKSASIKTGLLELSDFKTITILNIVPICFGVGSVISSNILLLFHSSTCAGVGERLIIHLSAFVCSHLHER